MWCICNRKKKEIQKIKINILLKKINYFIEHDDDDEIDSWDPENIIERLFNSLKDNFLILCVKKKESLIDILKLKLRVCVHNYGIIWP